MKFILRALLIALSGVLSSSVWAQRDMSSGGRSGGNAEITVQLRNPDGTAGPRGIHVRLESAEGGSNGDCITEQGGKCRFLPGSGGMYVIRLNQLGYKEVAIGVNLIDTLRAYITLELKPDPGAAPPDLAHAASGDSVSAADLGVPENARREFDKGESALKQSKLDAGIAHLRKAIKLYEPFPQAYTLLGTAYLEQNNWKAAETALHKATSLDANASDAYLALGAMFNQTKEYSRAESPLLRGLELKPDAPAGHYELAKTYWELGRWQEAAPHARKAVAGMPDVAGPHALLGNVFLRERNPQGALHEYQEYLRLDPNGSMAPGVRQMIQKLQKVLHP
jgi:predicted Zn-dependent protease